MNSRTHMIVGGLTGGLSAAYAVSQHSLSLPFEGYIVYPVVVTAAAAIGGIAPDIDMANSISGKYMRILLRLFFCISAALSILIFFAPAITLPFANNLAQVSTKIDRTYPLMVAAICVALYFIIEKAKHRGFTHTTAVLLIISLPLLYMFIKKPYFTGVNIAISVQIGFILGWLSHLVADTFNYPGVPWFWPLTSNHFNIMRINSGTYEETFFGAVSVLLFVIAYVIIALPGVI